MPDQEVLDVTLAVKDVTPDEKNALQDVEVNNETSEVTLYVEGEKLSTNGKLDFTLLNIAEGITFTGNENVTGTRETTPKTSVKVEVPARVGDYSFTLTGEGKVKKVTVHVVDSTMPTGYTFRTWRDEDINSITDEGIRANTTEVKGNKTLEQDTTSNITFKGNVNTMAEAEDGSEYYRVRIQVKDAKADDVIAISKSGRKYETSTIDNNNGELYVYLDAKEETTELVLANKNASTKQIEKETTSCHTVRFESASKIWLRDAKAPTGPERLNKDYVKNIEINNKGSHTLDVGVDFDNLEKIKIDGNNDIVKVSTDKNGDYWIPVVVTLGKDEYSQNGLTRAVYADENSDIRLDNSLTGANKQDVLLWVKSNKSDEQKTNLTLRFKRGSETEEELTVTVVLHDASAPRIMKVEAGDDENAKALQNLKVENTDESSTKRVRTDKITVDTYKYGMKETTRTNYEGKEETGRWYSIKLTFNVPVSSILFNNSGNKGNNKANKETWLPLSKVEGNEVTLWINRDSMEKETDKSTKSVEQTLCNKWTIKKTTDGKYDDDGDSNNAKWTVGVTVEETEKSKTATTHELKDQDTKYDIYNDYINDNQTPETLKLHATKIEEIVEDTDRHDGGKSFGTFEHTLYTSTNAGGLNITKMTGENKENIWNLKLNSSKVSEIKLNGVKGKWILVHLGVRGDVNTFKDETNSESSAFLEVEDANELLKNSKSTSSGAYLVPLWINLSDPKIVNATNYKKENDGNNKVTPFKVSFGTTNPVEEHNCIYIQIEDENPNTDSISESAKPEVVELGKISENDPKLDEELQTLFGTDSKFYQGESAKSFVKNMELLAEADISEEIVGDTIYVTIKDDFKKYHNKTDGQCSTDFNVAFDLDLSSLGVSNKDSQIYWYNDGGSSWKQDKINVYPIMRFGITIQSNDYSSLVSDGGKISKEYIFANCSGQPSDNNCSNIEGKYIRYVFKFIQEN